MTTEDLARLLAESPRERNARSRRARRIAASGSLESLAALVSRRERRQRSGWHDGTVNPGDDVAGVPRARSNPKRVDLRRRDPRSIPHATVCISYSESARHLFAQHDVAHYVNVARNGSGYARVDAYAILLQAVRR